MTRPKDKSLRKTLLDILNDAAAKVRRVLSRKDRGREDDPIGIISRPFGRTAISGDDRKKLMTKRNFKVYTFLGPDRRKTLSTLDTGAGPNIIRADLVPHDADIINVEGCDLVGASGEPLGITSLAVFRLAIGEINIEMEAYVSPNLATDLLLGCHFCDKYVESIQPRHQLVELHDGTIIPIVRRSRNRYPHCPVSFVDDRKGRVSSKITVAEDVVLEPHSQTFISVTSQKGGLLEISSDDRLYRKKHCLLSGGIAQVTPHEPFGMFIANFRKTPVRLQKRQVVGRAQLAGPHIYDTNIDINTVIGPVCPTPDSVASPNSHVIDPSTISPEPLSEFSFPEDEAVPPPPKRSELHPKRVRWSEREDQMIPDDHKSSSQPVCLTEKPDADTEALAHHREMNEKKDDPLDDLKAEHLSAADRDRLLALLAKYPKLYDGTMGGITVTQHAIDLVPVAKACHTMPYRTGQEAREIIKFEVDRMLKMKVIEPAQSEWASPVVLVPKADGSRRFCVDYRRLNKLTIRDSYPLPRMDECIDSLGEARYLTTLDCLSGFWQIPMKPEDRDKTTFVCHHGSYRYLRMPFGLMNSPATFQRAIDIILAGFKWSTCLIYLDDIIVFSKDKETHFKDLEDVLDALARANVTIKLKKCSFLTNKVKYLGHLIEPGRLSVDKASVAALQEALPPRNKTELRSFLGMCNVYRRFVHNYAKIVHPLNVLLKKEHGPSR